MHGGSYIEMLQCIFSRPTYILLHDSHLGNCVQRQCLLQLNSYSACAWIINKNMCACMLQNALSVDGPFQDIPPLYFSSHKRYYVSIIGPVLSITLWFIYRLKRMTWVCYHGCCGTCESGPFFNEVV
jgi:hypothetical protein